jgi:hypothetical protein
MVENAQIGAYLTNLPFCTVLCMQGGPEGAAPPFSKDRLLAVSALVSAFLESQSANGKLGEFIPSYNHPPP